MKGFTKVDNSILFSNDLDAISKLVYTSLNFFTRNGSGECFAKKETLSRMLNISTYQLRKALNQLSQLQLIHIERRGQGNPDTITLISHDTRSQNTSSQPSSYNKKKKIEEGHVSTADAGEDEKTTDVGNENHAPGPSKTPPDDVPAPDISQHQQDTDALLQSISGVIGNNRKMRLLEGLKVVGNTDNEIILSAGNIVLVEHIQTHYHQLLNDIVGKQVKLVR